MLRTSLLTSAASVRRWPRELGEPSLQSLPIRRLAQCLQEHRVNIQRLHFTIEREQLTVKGKRPFTQRSA